VSEASDDLAATKRTYSRVALYLFICLLGLMIRLPLYADKTQGAIFSIGIDTLLFVSFLPFGRFIERSRWSRITLANGTALVVVSMLMGLGISLCSIAFVHVEPVFRNRFHDHPLAAYPYFVLLYILLGLAAFWEKNWQTAVSSTRRAAQAEQRLMEAELKRLRSQIDPHFMFNTLNMALIEINRHPKRASSLIGELSAYLRHSLDRAHIAFVPLSAELAMVRSYLRIQSMRFGARLVCQMDVAAPARKMMVPGFLLQPLVENAIKYGIPDDNQVQRISISIERQGDSLLITIRNRGDLRMVPDANKGPGIGLANLRARLDIHYPGKNEVSLRQDEEDVIVTVRLEGEPC
jgi:hypothetical protein